VAEQHQRSHPHAIDSQAFGHAVDQLPARRDLTGFNGLPLGHFHPGRLGCLLDGAISFFSGVAKKAAEQMTPGLAAKGGSAMGPGRRLN